MFVDMFQRSLTAASMYPRIRSEFTIGEIDEFII